MDPIIERIGVCNAKLIRHAASGSKVVPDDIRRDLEEQCESIQRLNRGIANTDMFMRYLLRNIDFEERARLGRLAAEIDEYMVCIRDIHNSLVSHGYIASSYHELHTPPPLRLALSHTLAEHVRAR
jgi:hypothetical protein